MARRDRAESAQVDTGTPETIGHAAPGELERARAGARSVSPGCRAVGGPPGTTRFAPHRAGRGHARLSQRPRPISAHGPSCRGRPRWFGANRRSRLHRGSVSGPCGGPCELREIRASCLPVTRVAAPPPRRRHPRVPGGRLVRRRGTVEHEPRRADGAGCDREDLRGLPVHSSSWRHAVVDRLQAPARWRPEAACCRTRAAIARCRAGRG